MPSPSEYPSLAEAAAEPMEWRQLSAFSGAHELRQAGRLIARLRLEGLLRRRGEAECSAGTWRFVPRSFLSRDVRLIDARTENEVAVFRGGWFGRGTLVTASGESFDWRGLRLFRSGPAFVREDGEPLVEFRRRLSLLRPRAEVRVESDARRLGALPLLVIAGWYALLRRRRHASHG